jgi:hypothetical protein
MKIALASEAWAPPGSAGLIGPDGVAWWLGHALTEFGHVVTVLAAQTIGSTEDKVQPESGLGRLHVEVLPATWPPPAVQALSRDRVNAASTALPAIQRGIIDTLGATSDTSGQDLRGYDLVLGVGFLSPHVRAVLWRGLGSTSTAIWIMPNDLPALTVPLLRQAAKGHRLLTHVPEVAREASELLGRVVRTVPMVTDAKAVSVAVARHALPVSN